MLARELVFEAGEEGGRGGIEGSVRVLHDVWSMASALSSSAGGGEHGDGEWLRRMLRLGICSIVVMGPS